MTPDDFDPRAYLLINPDVAAAGIDPVAHYRKFGKHEGRAYRLNFSEQDRDRLSKSLLFDEEFYVDTYLGGSSSLEPDVHFLSVGAKSGFWPSLYFRSDWYQEQAGIAGTDINPLFHYLDHGYAAGHEPNPFFEPAYYMSAYADILNGEEPLTHFVREGHRGLNPSPRFDAKRYLDENPDASEGNPLLHYLTKGLPNGRKVYRACPPDEWQNLDSARLDILQQAPLRPNVALITTHYRDHVKPHVIHYANSLKAAGYSVVTILAYDEPVNADPWLQANSDIIVARENRGYDFAAWAHVLRAIPGILNSDTLLLTNDSIAGPAEAESFKGLLRRIDSSGSDIVGAVSNTEHTEHVQSFFVALKRKALASDALRDFFNSVVNLSDKNHVIREYEIPFTPQMRAAGLAVEYLFRPYKQGQNATIFHWKNLLDDGFPFVKMALISGPQAGMFGDEPVRELAIRGYPTQLVWTAPISGSKRRPLFSRIKAKIRQRLAL